jgi:hypothetical protein
LGFAAPKLGRIGGVWQADVSWESERYSQTLDESRAHGGLTLTDWLTGSLRYSLSAGVDTWSGSSFSGRSVFVGGSLERRWQDDRWSVAANGTAWVAPGAGDGFHTVAVQGAFRSSHDTEGWVYLADGGIRRATNTAPLAVWPRAGEGHDDSVLLRAHPLLRNGVIDVTRGVIGLTLVYSHAEAQRWLASVGPARIGGALFADLARSARAQVSPSPSTHADVGGGLRLRAPGLTGTLRVDFARGLRDGARALTVGWQF